MPYIPGKENGALKEQRKMLEPHLHFLAKRIREVARLYRESPEGRIPIYRYVCEKLALKVQPQKRYEMFSAVRAVFSDASYEWCRKMKVQPAKLQFVGSVFPVLNKRIEKLACEIKKIAALSQEPHLVWRGIFNYSITVLGLKIMDNKEDRRLSAFIAGTLQCLHHDFYNKYLAPYEDEQSAKNGDVYL